MGSGASTESSQLFTNNANLFNSLASSSPNSAEQVEELIKLEKEAGEGEGGLLLRLTYCCTLTEEASTESEIRNIIGVAQVRKDRSGQVIFDCVCVEHWCRNRCKLAQFWGTCRECVRSRMCVSTKTAHHIPFQTN